MGIKADDRPDNAMNNKQLFDSVSNSNRRYNKGASQNGNYFDRKHSDRKKAIDNIKKHSLQTDINPSLDSRGVSYALTNSIRIYTGILHICMHV